jgi:hypothetical protein
VHFTRDFFRAKEVVSKDFWNVIGRCIYDLSCL